MTEAVELIGWDRLRHGGLLLDPARLRRIAGRFPDPLSPFVERELRQLASKGLEESGDTAEFVTFVLEVVCGFTAETGTWQRGPQVGVEWGRRAVTGEAVKPRLLWSGPHGAILPVFFDSEPRLGIGRGRKAASQTVQWLRAGSERLAVLTNGRQWRLVFAGLDFDAWCEWDVDLWFEEGTLSSQVSALRTLLAPALWTPPAADAPCPLLEAILDSRKGQADLSTVLGERVREAVELLVQAHGEVLKERCAGVEPAEIYRAAVRMVMRMVVVLFAESRDLLPRDNALYHGAYGLTGLLEDLEKVAARGGNRLARSWNAWPRVLALFRLVHQGSHHPALPVPAYGGELFATGDPASTEGLSRALAVFERACFERDVLSDRDVHRMLERITRTRVKVRQGKTSTWVPAPVDFSDLSSEYIGILYEGLLDFELKTAPAGDPVVFLAVGHQPALPLSRLEAMDDRALANLLETMKDTSTGDDEAEESEEEQPADDEEAAEDDQPEPDDVASGEADVTAIDEGDVSDHRHATRTRAETWARRAVEVGKLAPKPRGAPTAEKHHAYEQAVSRKARQLVVRVILPGEWYLVRWGGTRKGSGTFYTRPGLAVPTVQRTLRPLAYTPPAGAGSTPDLDAPPTAWTPKPPEDILALKVCDPACGSGTFPVAALRFLTDALFASLHHHDRISADGDRALVRLLGGAAAPGSVPDERLGHELLPCRPDDPFFEQRLKAILRRHVVERSIYGVDLDPLAVELCRLALWIETMDRTLPFSFLDHKIKCGNSLVGAWFDQFQHYPVMAWKNREGGDKNHGNGVHFQKDARGQALKAFVKDKLTPDLRRFLAGRTLFSEDLQEQAASVHAEALATLSRLHDLPVQDAAERARIYRDELVGSPEYRSLETAMDLWCSCWFWPADQLDHAPLPTTLARPSAEARAISERLFSRKRFFHWELEFPDVFRAADSGFDAVLGNPPWDIAKPNSKEFFSNIDPLYPSYGKQEALGFQTRYFGEPATERAWLDYNADFRAQSQYMKFAAVPFGDPGDVEDNADRFAIARGKDNVALHARWRSAREKSRGFADAAHPFRHQGSADINLYKAFLEQAHALLRVGGRLGFIAPSGLYSDHGTGGLRRLFLDRCRWEWLFGFENRDGIFDIHRSFKFNPVIIEKGGTTEAIRTAFMRRKLEDWGRAEALATPYTRAQVERFSPRSRAILEIQSQRDLEVLEKIYANSVLLGDDGPNGWGITYATEFHMTNDSALLIPRSRLERQGLLRPDADVRALDTRKQLRCSGFLPVWEGKTCAFDLWLKQPSLFVALNDAEGLTTGAFPYGIRRIARNTDERTLVTCIIPPGIPTTYTIEVCRSPVARDALASLALVSSFVLDYVARMQVDESVPLSLLHGLPFPPCASTAVTMLARSALALLDPNARPFTRLGRRCALDAMAAAVYGLRSGDLAHILRDCDYPVSALKNSIIVGTLNSTGFWRVDKEKDPELRQTVLTLLAFLDLEHCIRGCAGDLDDGLRAFSNSNDRQGWLPPETLRLADYGLGRDQRAREPQPVASRLRHSDVDIVVGGGLGAEWRVHTDLLGEHQHREIAAAIDAWDARTVDSRHVAGPASSGHQRSGQRSLFE